MNQQIIINFKPSDYDRTHGATSISKNFSLQLGQVLPPLTNCFINYNEKAFPAILPVCLNQEKNIYNSYNVIIIPLQNINQTENKLILIKFSELKKWIVFKHFMWSETHRIDEDYLGPYEPDFYCNCAITKFKDSLLIRNT